MADSDSNSLLTKVSSGDYIAVLSSSPAKTLITNFANDLASSKCSDSSRSTASEESNVSSQDEIAVGLAALNAFLQANVTGPVLDGADKIEAQFAKGYSAGTTSGGTSTTIKDLRVECLNTLKVDGVAPYAYIPHIELFALARHIFERSKSPAEEPISLPAAPQDKASSTRSVPSKISLSWLRLRVSIWQYRLLTQPSLTGSSSARSAHWIDVPTLAERISHQIAAVRATVLPDEVEADVWSVSGAAEAWASREEQVQFLLESANAYIMLTRDDKAKEAVTEAARRNGFLYKLSGALGKRTKWQEKNTSQLVVLAKSRGKGRHGESGGAVSGDADAETRTRPEALELNDDTLLENIEFSKDRSIENGNTNGENNILDDQETGVDSLPAALADLDPAAQPQLTPLDQAILLTEATLKDAFSPADALTAEEVLPYAARVIADDKSTNWQVYTQALLVRSRIETHRSRTIERGVLQLQAVVDQVIVDTGRGESSAQEQQDTERAAKDDGGKAGDGEEVPAIAVTAPDAPADATSAKDTEPVQETPTSFFPASTSTADSAPAHVRLAYVHALASPPRWHLESELAHAWAGVGSLVSALEIFKRLRLWAEVALCLASTSAHADEDELGRGVGGEGKARGVLRWRLFRRSDDKGASVSSDPDSEPSATEPTHISPSLYTGPHRNPLPPDAPRLLCLLGDMESDPAHYEKAWEASGRRYARAQKSLGEHYLLVERDLVKARGAYELATKANRLSPDLWSRLGDIDLKLGNSGDAAESYRRGIAAAGQGDSEDARTWSNLGSALWKMYLEVEADKETKKKEEEEKETESTTRAAERTREQEQEDWQAQANERHVDPEDDEDETHASVGTKSTKDPDALLAQALAAYKRGAQVAADNWRIWDNVLTLASRTRPPSYSDIVLATRAAVRIRGVEDAVDADVLGALLRDVLLEGKSGGAAAASSDGGIYEPPRGTLERGVVSLLEDVVLPLITTRSDLWVLVSRERLWRRDYKGAIEAAEKGWRAAMGGATGVVGGGGAGLAPGAAASSASRKNWLEDGGAWEEVVARTDELVSVLENFGEQAEGVGAKWRGKARSAVRSVMSKGREPWEGSEGWSVLEGLMGGLEIKP